MVEAEPAQTTAAKTQLRVALRAARRAMSPAQRVAAQADLCRLLEVRFASQPPVAVASYAALADEASVDAWHARWWAAGNCVWLPRVSAPGVLSWHAVSDPLQLTRGAYGIREPLASVVPAAPLPPQATLLVPGVGFTADGWRLGQGGGFYDRVLAVHQGPAIGIAFSCQRVAALPRGPYDRQVNEVFFGD